MIEITVRQYLADKLKLPVYLEHEKNMPESYIMLEKTGGSMNNKLLYSTIAIQFISTSMLNAATINEDVKKAMNDIAFFDDNITKSKLNSDYNFTDTETKKYRYQAVYDIIHFE